MKCQECSKPATFHITELVNGQAQELHFCEEHAREYLTHGEEEQTAAPSLAGALAHQLTVGQTAEELARLDQKACPVCGITFYEFRSQGRFGCPHDYECFAEELKPLLMSIHGDVQHVGKRPTHSASDSLRQTELIRLRREMKDAVTEEDYERASQLRDDIRKIEEGADVEAGAEEGAEASTRREQAAHEGPKTEGGPEAEEVDPPEPQ
ncbi:MAG: DNA helicase UvrBC [Planctomycetota bacterium]|nr:MAG: DNA helicase UvrBC [Planctomycetota bacterium]